MTELAIAASFWMDVSNNVKANRSPSDTWQLTACKLEKGRFCFARRNILISPEMPELRDMHC